MTQEEKDLLLKDLCCRLPYGVHILYDNTEVREMGLGSLHDFMFDSAEVKPYLRSMSSMTEEEAIELCTGVHDKVLRITEKNYTCILSIDQIDWLNSRHFDYSGLIDKGLALEAQEGMYNN